MKILQDNKGKSSIKRWLMIILITFSLGATAVDQFTDYKLNTTLIKAFFEGAIFLGAGTVIEKYKRRSRDV